MNGINSLSHNIPSAVKNALQKLMLLPCEKNLLRVTLILICGKNETKHCQDLSKISSELKIYKP